MITHVRCKETQTDKDGRGSVYNYTRTQTGSCLEVKGKECSFLDGQQFQWQKAKTTKRVVHQVAWRVP